MWTLIKSQLHAFSFHRFTLLSLGFVLFLVGFSYVTFATTFTRINEPYKAFQDSQQVEDFYLVMGNMDFRYLTANQQVYMCQALSLVTECSLYTNPKRPDLNNYLNILVQQRLNENPILYEAFLEDLMDTFAQNYDLHLEKTFVLDIKEEAKHYKVMSLTETINLPYVKKGRLPDTRYEVAIYEEYANKNALKLHDRITLAGVEHEITGFIYQVDFSKPIFSLSDLSFDPYNQTLVLTTEEGVKALGTPTIKYVGTGDIYSLYTSLSLTDLIVQDASRLGKNMQMAEIIVLREYNSRIIGIENEIAYASRFLVAFSLIFYGFVFLLTGLFTERYYQYYEKNIQTLHTLGYTHHEIALALLTLPFLMCIGLFLGFIASQGASILLYPILMQNYLIPKSPYSFSLMMFFISVLLPTLLLLSFVYVRYRLRFVRKVRKTTVLKGFAYVRPFAFFFHSLLFFTLAGLLLVAFSFSRVIPDFIETTSQGVHFEEMVLLRKIRDDDWVEKNQKFLRLRAYEPTKHFHTSLYGLDPSTPYKHLIDDAYANNALLHEGIIISAYSATRYGIDVGDTLTLEVGYNTLTLPVVGIANERIENAMYISYASLALLNHVSMTSYNGYFTNTPQADPDAFERINYHDALIEIKGLLYLSFVVLTIITSLAFLLSIYVLYFSTSSYFSEEHYTIASLKALGYSTKEILEKYVPLLFLALLLGFILAYLAARKLFNVLLSAILANTGLAFFAQITIKDLLFSLLLMLATFTLSMVISLRVIDRVDVGILLKKDA